MAAHKWAWRVVAATAVAPLLAAAVASPAWADRIRDMQWHLAYLKTDRVQKITKGKGVTVAVVDTGVDGRHADLSGNVLKGKDFGPPLATDGWDDTDGHGTGMASIIGGHGHGPAGRDGVLGLAPEVKILPAAVGSIASSSVEDKALRWVVDHGAKVINFSGATENLDGAVSYALRHDVVVVAAAGNTRDGDIGVGEPASLPGVIAVSGVGKDGEFTDASVDGPEVALAAPAVDMVGADSRTKSKYGIGTGTSSATAIVSATAALVRAKYPDLNAANVIERLITTADDNGPKGRDNKYGFGVVNPLKALTADIPKVDRNPLGGPSAGGSDKSGAAPTFTAPEASGFRRSGVLLLAAGAVLSLALLGLGTWWLCRRRSVVPGASGGPRSPVGPYPGAYPTPRASQPWSSSRPRAGPPGGQS